MNTACTSRYFKVEPKFLSVVATLSILASTHFAMGQRLEATPLLVSGNIASSANSVASSSKTTASLPDAPSTTVLSASAEESSSLQDAQAPREPQPNQPSKSIKPAEVERHWYGLGNGDADRASQMADTTDKYILPGQLAPKLTAGDKVELGLVHGVSPYSILGWFVSAGYSHVVNSRPNYGTDKGAFGERLGAAALRGYTEEVFSDSVMAPLLHQDPRYYKLGPSHNVAVRTAYAVSRVLVTRNDDGHLAPNYSLVAGNLMAASLTNAYYPAQDRGARETALTFGAAMGGAAFSYFASEFVSGALEAIHIRQHR